MLLTWFDGLFEKVRALAGKWTWIEDLFTIEHGDIPASYVSLPEGSQLKGVEPSCATFDSKNRVVLQL